MTTVEQLTPCVPLSTVYNGDMNNAAIKAIKAVAETHGVKVSFYDERSAALGRPSENPDRVHASSKVHMSLIRFRNDLFKMPEMKGCRITKTVASAGYWNMGKAGDISYSRTVKL